MEHEICNGKKCYSKRGALSAKKKRYKESHIELRVYQCNQGDHWHLTKQLEFDRKKEYKLKPILRKHKQFLNNIDDEY